MRLLPRRLFKKYSIGFKAGHRNGIAKYDPSSTCEPTTKCTRLSYISSSEYAWDHETRTGFDWEPLANVLNSKEASDLSVLAAISKEFSTGCILHEAISLGVPDNILILLAERFPMFLIQIDSNDRYPIHVACAFGTSSEFVSHCIDMNPSSAAAKDIEGKHPIHLLCQGTWRGFWDIKSNSAAEKNMAGILCMLYCNAPSSIASEDDHGVGSIEYAIESNLGIEFIRTLQRMVSHINKNEARRVARRKCMAARHQLQREFYPTLPFKLTLFKFHSS